MDNNRIEYVFKECECRRADFVYFNASKKTPICPEHRTRLAHKIRWCSVCGAETVCSNYSNSKRFICPGCRRVNNLKIKRDRALKKKNSKLSLSQKSQILPSISLMPLLRSRYPAPSVPGRKKHSASEEY